MKKYWKAALIGFLFLASAGVFYFDTYPTYLATHVTLSPTECEQVATIVAAQAYKEQNPTEVVPAGVENVLKSTTRLSKRVATYILNKNPDLAKDMPAGYLYQGLYQSCMMSEGNADLK